MSDHVSRFLSSSNILFPFPRKVRIFTSHCDPGHSFPETQDGTLDVVVAGDFLPRHFFHRGYALCAYIRMLYVATYVVVTQPRPIAIFCDSISIPIPLLRLLSPVLFYCHFPDKMLCVERSSFLKRLYRFPLDWMEEVTTSAADLVLVNSHFTRSVFEQSFPSIRSLPGVLYPPLNLSKFDAECPLTHADLSSSLLLSSSLPTEGEWVYDKGWRRSPVPFPKSFFLSINRFESKKNIELALHSFAEFLFGEQDEVKDKEKRSHREDREDVFLVLAGGYDLRVDENVHYLRYLNGLAHTLGLSHRVLFLLSFSDDQKIFLLRHAIAVLYTPSMEHFGIVPIEAMYSRTPVIAVNSGGPKESVVDGKTGYLCDADKASFRKAMDAVFGSEERREEMGRKGRVRVIEHFSLESFRGNISRSITKIARERGGGEGGIGRYFWSFVLALLSLFVVRRIINS